jgi:hypothetical protein
MDRVQRITQGDVHIDRFAHVIEQHDQHDESAQDADDGDARTRRLHRSVGRGRRHRAIPGGGVVQIGLVHLSALMSS